MSLDVDICKRRLICTAKKHLGAANRPFRMSFVRLIMYMVVHCQDKVEGWSEHEYSSSENDEQGRERGGSGRRTQRTIIEFETTKLNIFTLFYTNEVSGI